MLNFQYNLKELIETLEEHGETDEFIRDTFRFNLLADENFGVEEVLFDAHISRESKLKFLSETITSHIGSSFNAFLEQLIQNDDIVFYQLIISKFLNLLEKEKDCLFVELTSAEPLNRANLDRIKHTLEHLTRNSLYLYNSTSKKVVGGFLIKIGERVLDLTLQNDLEKLKFKLKAS